MKTWNTFVFYGELLIVTKNVLQNVANRKPKRKIYVMNEKKKEKIILSLHLCQTK